VGDSTDSLLRSSHYSPADQILAFVGMNASGKAMSDDERKRIMQDIATDSMPVLQRYSAGSEVVFELRTNLAIATR